MRGSKRSKPVTTSAAPREQALREDFPDSQIRALVPREAADDAPPTLFEQWFDIDPLSLEDGAALYESGTPKSRS